MMDREIRVRLRTNFMMFGDYEKALLTIVPVVQLSVWMMIFGPLLLQKERDLVANRRRTIYPRI